MVQLQQLTHLVAAGDVVKVDLKGALLLADIVPLAGTAMVLNVQPG